MGKAAFCWSQPAAVLLGMSAWSQKVSTFMRYLWHVSICVTSSAGIKHEGSEQGSHAENFEVMVMALLPPTSLILLIDLSRSSMLLKIRQVLAIKPCKARMEILAWMYLCKVFKMLHLKPWLAQGHCWVVRSALWCSMESEGVCALAAGLSLSHHWQLW